MSLWILLHFFSFVTNFYLAIYIMVRNPRGRLNRVCAATMASFAIWSLGITFIRNPHLSLETITQINNITAAGWIVYPSLFLTFSLVYTRRNAAVDSWLYRVAVALPPLVFYAFQLDRNLIHDFTMKEYGWVGKWVNAPWTYCYFAYYISFTIMAIFFIGRYMMMVRDPVKRKQARSVFLAALIALPVGSLTSVFFRMAGIYTIPPLGDVLSLALSAGLFYASYRYQLFTLTPSAAAEKIIETMSDALFLTDSSGMILTSNSATVHLLGCDRSELSGANLRDLLDPGTEGTSLFRHIMSAESTATMKTAIHRRDGPSVPVIISSSIMCDDSGEPMGCVCVMHDITELKLAEDEIIAARVAAEKANRAKSIFLANMSHEIRTPISAVTGFTDLLLREENEPSRLEKLNFILTAGRQLSRMINDILDFSKIESGTFEFIRKPFSPGRLVENAISFFKLRAEEKGIRLIADRFSDTALVVLGDEERLRQVVSNLLDNAIKFTNRGSVTVGFRYDGNCVIINVTDTGVGIPIDDRERIFKAFEQGDQSTTRQYSGVGLGLAITKSIVERQGGTIILSNPPEGGSRFVITIPMPVFTGNEAPADTIETPVIPCAGRIDLSHHRILVAEDNEMVQKLLLTVFRLEGIPCDFASNGRETLDMLRRQRYDLLVMDIQMPEMDGITALGHIRNNPGLAALPVIALTAHAMKGDEEKYLRAGFDYYISKPVNIDSLMETIRNILAAAM
jgi:PAS domain S-box-containing protein